MNYIQDAIHLLERSFGENSNIDYKHDLQTMAIGNALISIAQSLEKIAGEMEAMKTITEQDFNMTANLKIFGRGE